MISKDVDQPYLKCTCQVIVLLYYLLVYIDRVESSKASLNKIVSLRQRRLSLQTSPTKRTEDEAKVPLSRSSTQPDEVNYIFSHFYYDHNISSLIMRTRTLRWKMFYIMSLKINHLYL